MLTSRNPGCVPSGLVPGCGSYFTVFWNFFTSFLVSSMSPLAGLKEGTIREQTSHPEQPPATEYYARSLVHII